MTNMTTSRNESFGPANAEAQFEAILERVLRAYHRDEGHGGANWIGERILDAELVPVAREAFLEADDMPPITRCCRSSTVKGCIFSVRATTS